MNQHLLGFLITFLILFSSEMPINACYSYIQRSQVFKSDLVFGLFYDFMFHFLVTSPKTSGERQPATESYQRLQTISSSIFWEHFHKPQISCTILGITSPHIRFPYPGYRRLHGSLVYGLLLMFRDFLSNIMTFQ